MYDEKVTYRVGINWKDILLKIILLVLFILLLLWLFPKPQLDTFYDSIFNNNIQTMKDAAVDYYTVDRLPENVGDTATMTLGEMINNKLIIKFVDKDNNYCDETASFIQVTKTNDSEYALKVQLTCGEQSDYILSTIGCHEVCENGNCQTIVQDPVDVPDPEEPETEEVLQYQFKKEVKSTKTVYSCPSGYTLSGSICKKSVVGNTINATPEYFSDTTISKDAEKNTSGSYIVYATPTKEVKNVNYTCPEGYTLNGSACVKTTAATYKSGDVTYTCPTGYTKIGTTCFQSIPATAQQGEGSYTCPTGYTLNGTNCVKTYNATYKSGSTTYTCPSGYTLNGTKCTKTYSATYKSGSTTYSCPSGYTKTGSGSSTKCYKKTAATKDSSYGSWYLVRSYYQTDTKQTYENATEKLVYVGSQYDYTCATVSKCPVKVMHYSYKLYRRDVTTTYTCPSGYTKDGTNCYLYTNPTKSTGNGSYSCPNGGTLSGSTCTITQNATANSGNGSYSCPSGGTLNGTTCTITKAATYSSGTTTYTCPTGYTKIGSTCTIYINATQNAEPGAYSCPTGYTLDGATCYAYASSTPNYEYNYTCPADYTKEGSGEDTTCKKTVTGTTTYYCKNDNETLKGDKCYSTVKGAIKGYSCPTGYTKNGTVCVSYKTETINATASQKETSSYEYKWSEYSTLEGWTATGKTRTIEKEIASVK